MGVALYARVSTDEQAEHLAKLLKEELRANHQIGIGRFEALLNAVDLGGRIHETVRRTFVELSEIRHVLVHRRGKADAKLLERCPWLPVELGQTVNVGEPELHLYQQVSMWYVVEIERRLALSMNGTQPEEEAQLQTLLEARIAKINDHVTNSRRTKLTNRSS